VSRVLALDIGGTNTKAGLVDGSGTVTGGAVVPTSGPDPEGFLDSLTAAVVGVIPPGSPGVGVSVAGFLDEERSKLVFNPNIEWLQHFPLRRAMEERLKVPVFLENDSNAAVLAEWTLGEGRGSKRFLCVTAGTGIGAGAIMNGEVLRLSQGCIGDAGHVIVEPGGRACSCGGRGCAEALASAPFVIERYAERSGHAAASAGEVIGAARAGDTHAIAVLAEAGGFLGTCLASLANIFFPDTIAVGGGVAEAGDLFLSPAIETFRISTGPFAGRARVVRAALGWQASLIGAALPLL
jgi:glucokinase